MADTSSLAGRIDAEFSAVADKVKKFQAEQMAEYKERQKRVEQLNKVFDELREIWKPRLEMLMKKFGDRVQAKPRIVPSTREASFEFQSKIARVRFKIAASTDRDVRSIILSYDLEIIPILMKYTPHGEVEFPLTAVNKDAVAKWIDDAIVHFVRTYLSMGEEEIYLKDYMVEDPIAHVRFPSIAAGASLDWQGQKFYFIGEETRQEFAKQKQIVLGGKA